MRELKVGVSDGGVGRIGCGADAAAADVRALSKIFYERTETGALQL